MPESISTGAVRYALRRLVPAVASGLVLSGAVPAPAAAETDARVALVIGNSDYANVTPLPNPANDAADVSAALDRLGFEVTRVDDATREGMLRSLRAFSRRTATASVALVFYAGHGVEMGGTNYLVPVDAQLDWDSDVQYEAIPLDAVLAATEGARRMRVVILDACRNNPFEVQPRNPTRSVRVGRGLAEIELPAGRNVLVAYATAAGAVADDGGARNSPYTQALLQHLEEPNVELHMLFRRVTDTVLASTAAEQQPYLYASLSADPYYLNPVAATPPALDVIDENARRLVDLLGRPLSSAGRDENRWTDLHYAAALNLPNLVAALADEGASVDAGLGRDGSRVTGSLGQTLRALGRGPDAGRMVRDGAAPLHVAARTDGREAVLALLAQGANIDVRDTGGKTPLHDASAADALEIVHELLAGGADVRARDNDGNTPLHSAAAGGARAVMEELLSRGADVRARNNAGATPLDLMARPAPAAGDAARRRPANGDSPLRGGPPAPPATGASPDARLRGAVRADDVGALRALLDGGASAHARDADGNTPLHHAAQVNAVDVIFALAARGANVQARNNRGNTPLHYAALRGARAAVRALRQVGASARARNDSGQTPLDIARLSGADEATVRELRRP